ncbi:trypsin-like serine peptidase [Kitasatospora kifunensis]|uniref:V8-like Glu-specific endopeptidase n=1 Tax=Kitasatospora kifunensis TaxID=58351 RepID=A0A7W7VV61_KITKI|nr:serine protease [Kitasatospora kifunensis]MBB4923563.1 V8-like Glu-specific endopeptidase [Kitasatospora kifunensis]
MTTGTAPVTPESNRVGALFSGSATAGNHFCSASVVHSSTRNLLVTAAHCVSSASGVTFVPGYRNGQTPYGVWQVTQVYETNGWTQNGDTDQDFAFLQVAPNSSGQRIEDVVGGNTLGLNESFGANVRLYGYPNTSEVPLLCADSTGQQSTYQRSIYCPSYTGGTSGGPWINTADGNVIGVIGGYQQGGNTPDISYSAYFDQTIGNLYNLAVSSST